MNDIIEAISCEREIIQLKLLNVPKHPKMIAKIFSILKDDYVVSGILFDVASEYLTYLPFDNEYLFLSTHLSLYKPPLVLPDMCLVYNFPLREI